MSGKGHFKIRLNESQSKMMVLELEKELGIKGDGLIEISYQEYLKLENPIELTLREE